MKKLFILVVLGIALSNLNAQDCLNVKSLSHPIDSICKANNIVLCNVYFGTPGSTVNCKIAETKTGNFRFDKNFLIVNNTSFYNLDKLLYFEINIKKENPGKNSIEFFFQGS